MNHFILVVFIACSIQAWEVDNSAFRLLHLAEIPGSSIFLAKSSAMLIILCGLWLFEIFIWILYFEQNILLDLSQHVNYIQLLVLSGFFVSAITACSSSILSLMTSFTQHSILILFVLYFPVVLPVYIVAARIMNQVHAIDHSNEWSLIYASFFISLGLGLFTYELLLED